MNSTVTFTALFLGVICLTIGSSNACRTAGEGCAGHIACCGGLTCAISQGMWGFCQLASRSKRQSCDEGGSRASHIVVAGDTLFNIGVKYGKDWHKIATDNNISNPDRIYPGQVLVLN